MQFPEQLNRELAKQLVGHDEGSVSGNDTAELAMLTGIKALCEISEALRLSPTGVAALAVIAEHAAKKGT